ncbi:hypothetical protein HZS_7500, partial [Henneguya salminicola]
NSQPIKHYHPERPYISLNISKTTKNYWIAVQWIFCLFFKYKMFRACIGAQKKIQSGALARDEKEVECRSSE